MPSIRAVLDLQTSASKTKTALPLVLAINDGEDPAVARSAAAKNNFTATLVTDRKRDISTAYGVTFLPTIVTLSASGSVTGIRYGYTSSGHPESPSAPPKTVPSKERQK